MDPFQIDFFNAGEDPCDVLDEDHGVLFVKKPDGRATGDAFVLFKEEGDGEKALQKHKEIIEVAGGKTVQQHTRRRRDESCCKKRITELACNVTIESKPKVGSCRPQ